MYMTATLPRAARSLSLFARLVSWYECSRSRVHLSRLDDKMLDDLGLSRADVHHECSKPFWA
ncbi:Uncharacterized conserved protein YjiS, DUF1127 family [Monaibacterium marinum]|uniref:Uncharacterized conserved protein YjiS, DUF1127 family n=2 Tax=Pontivivens marinum TaxID=1690039 RepID=A0A2C9CMA1_9RHOB|nr:Uncharacterized conserved protein YjiS, DUF1127 family [Monaibacterium marinum]